MCRSLPCSLPNGRMGASWHVGMRIECARGYQLKPRARPKTLRAGIVIDHARDRAPPIAAPAELLVGPAELLVGPAELLVGPEWSLTMPRPISGWHDQ